MTMQAKVPSLISYGNDYGFEGGLQWGNNILPGAVAMMHTKLQLDVQTVSEELNLIMDALDGVKDFDFSHIQYSVASSQYTDKSAEEIITDYLTLVFNALCKQIEALMDTFRLLLPVDIVITIPAVGYPNLYSN
jgi:hypothetical protein